MNSLNFANKIKCDRWEEILHPRNAKGQFKSKTEYAPNYIVIDYPITRLNSKERQKVRQMCQQTKKDVLIKELEVLDLDGFSMVEADKICNAIKDMSRKYLITANKITSKCISPEKVGMGVLVKGGETSYGYQQDRKAFGIYITLNTDDYSKTQIAYGRKSGVFTRVDDKNTDIANIIHELGHTIYPLKGIISLGKETQEKYYPESLQIQSLYNDYKNTYSDLTIDDINAKIKQGDKNIGTDFLSLYALQDEDEFVAECICNAELCSNPSSYALKVRYIIQSEVH